MADPLIEAITKWVQAAPEPVRAMIANRTANVTTDKKAKADVNYRPADDPAESCATCTNFDGSGGCDRTSGSIKPTYVCDQHSNGGSSDSASDPDNDGDPGSNEDGADESAE